MISFFIIKLNHLALLNQQSTQLHFAKCHLNQGEEYQLEYFRLSLIKSHLQPFDRINKYFFTFKLSQATSYSWPIFSFLSIITYFNTVSLFK